MIGLDWGYGTVNPREIKDQGFEFVCRYLSHSPLKNISPEELQQYRELDLKVVLVWESTADRCLEGFDAGVEDAITAKNQAQVLGLYTLLTSPVIYFACDDDFSLSDQPDITDYFKGVNSIIGLRKTGVYGGLDVVKRTLDAGVASYAWQTSAWSHHEWDDRTNIRQISYDTVISGVQCDKNESMTEDFGQV